MDGIFDLSTFFPAVFEAFKKLNPLRLYKNPVMFSVEIGGLITTANLAYAFMNGQPYVFLFWISLWLWLTVFFGTFAESLAELRGRARTDELKKARSSTTGKRLDYLSFDARFELVNATQLRKEDLVLLEAGDVIPSDGEVVMGSALVDESAVTGESAPVIRESGGERCGVVAGAKLLSSKVIVKVTVDQGETFIDRMINMIDAAKRPRTPNEIALEILLVSLTIVFLLVVANLWALSAYSAESAGKGSAVDIAVLVSLFVCLAPTTIAALLPAIGIAGMDRLSKKNVVALSGRAVEAAGDVSTILLDKTGTITYGNRQAVEFMPVGKHSLKELADAAYIASIRDETPEGKSIVKLAKENHDSGSMLIDEKEAHTVPFTPQTRMSGTDYKGLVYRKGAADSIIDMVKLKGGTVPEKTQEIVDGIAKQGGTPLVVYADGKVLGVIHLKDVLKQGIKERLAEIRLMGIKTIILTGDNPLTAACIAKEAGIEDYVAQAKPEDKLRIIREEQKKGLITAMTGDGTNDAPALAQADVAVAMSEGTQVAKEAANMIDLDNHPAKLIDIVKIGREILMTRGALTTFSITNDIAKYFAIVPSALYTIYPELGVFNILGLSSPWFCLKCSPITFYLSDQGSTRKMRGRCTDAQTLPRAWAKNISPRKRAGL